ENGQKTRTHEKKITIEFHESIDYKVSAMIDLYRKIVYDFEYRRWTLPRNLRWFQMFVTIKDPRTFWSPGEIQRHFYQNSQDPVSSNPLYKGEDTDDELAVFVFNFTKCEIDFAESFGFLETVNNSTGDEAVSQKLVIQ